MTHDELLAKIDQEVKDNEFACMVMAGAPDWILNSLRAVVELHYEYTSGSGDVYCYNCLQKYPCLTIQAIEKELG